MLCQTKWGNIGNTFPSLHNEGENATQCKSLTSKYCLDVSNLPYQLTLSFFLGSYLVDSLPLFLFILPDHFWPSLTRVFFFFKQKIHFSTSLKLVQHHYHNDKTFFNEEKSILTSILHSTKAFDIILP